MADPKTPERAEDRSFTPEPGAPDGDIRDKVAPPKGLDPDSKRDEGDPALTELERIEGEPPLDLNREQQS